MSEMSDAQIKNILERLDTLESDYKKLDEKLDLVIHCINDIYDNSEYCDSAKTSKVSVEDSDDSDFVDFMDLVFDLASELARKDK